LLEAHLELASLEEGRQFLRTGIGVFATGGTGEALGTVPLLTGGGIEGGGMGARLGGGRAGGCERKNGSGGQG
jgi:hypothetical protein